MHPVPGDQSRECLSCPLTRERAGPGAPEGACILGAGPAPEPSLQRVPSAPGPPSNDSCHCWAALLNLRDTCRAQSFASRRAFPG